MLERKPEGLYFKGEPLFIWGTDYREREPASVGTLDRKVIVIADEENIYYYREGELVWSHTIEFKYWPLQRMSISEDGQFVAVYSAFRNEVNLDVFKATGESVKEFSLRDWGDRVISSRFIRDFWESGPTEVFDRPGGGFNTQKIVDFLMQNRQKKAETEIG